MFCPNCGNKINKNEDFCSSCGTNVKNLFPPKNNIFLKCLQIFVNNKKKVSLTFCASLIVVVSVLLFNRVYGFHNLSWDDSYSDYKLTYVSQTNVKLGVKYNGNDGLKNIKYMATCGEVKSKGLNIIWDLTNSKGDCVITAQVKKRKITKSVKVIDDKINEADLWLSEDEDFDSDDDSDYDGLSNKQEKEYGTNPKLLDSDMDGLDDYYEIFTSKTDPLKKDSDNDGLNDYDEIELGLNPLEKDSKNDGLLDGNRTLTYEYEKNNIKIIIKGTGNIASVNAIINSDTKISNKKGLINKLYTFYTDGKIKEAEVVIPYTDEELIKYGLSEDNLSLYYYNTDSSVYEKIDTVIDKENNILKANLEHFSNYVIGDSSLVSNNISTEVLFILDNSWSMYSDEDYKKITGNDSTSKWEGFDASGLRFKLTDNLMTRLGNKNYKIGLSEFRRDYQNIMGIGSSLRKLKSAIELMNGNFSTILPGTDISNALVSGIQEFSDDDTNKYIVLLTDGQDSDLHKEASNVINKATLKNVKICSIGFGGGSYNMELANISNATGCKFYSSGEASGLTELFEKLGSELDDDLVDIDNDNKADGILVADSDFIVNRDGFSFNNYRSNLADGHCYGMATFAQLYYKKMLPLTFQSKVLEDARSYAYDLTNISNNYPNLYSYKLQSNALKYTFGFDVFKEEVPSDYRVLEKNRLLISSKYKQDIERLNLYDINQLESSLTKEEKEQRYGVNFKTYEVPYLNEDKMQNNSVMVQDDVELLNAIYASFIKQYNASSYSSGMNFVLWLRNVIGTESNDYSGQQGFINILKTRITDKDPVVLASNYSGGLHAINAISLVQSIDNPNYYYIGVYDNNYPGEKRYVDVECKNDSCFTVSNSYYSMSGEPLRITPSLEYDLNYFKQ